MKKNILLKIKYDGKDFHGWQVQDDVRTVQGEIEHILKFIAGEDVFINGTSRTDSGVHALGQCANFFWDNNLPTEKLADIMNKRLGSRGLGRSGTRGDIEILSATEVPMDFHARFDCKGKTYKYVIDAMGDVFQRNYCWQLPQFLNIEKMKEASEYIIGTHDFKCFESSGANPRETTVRTIEKILIEPEKGYGKSSGKLNIEVTGDGFLYNMVRIIVGTLVEVGIGKREPSSIPEIIMSKDRSKAGMTAPPQGLYLKEIYFGGKLNV